MMDLRRRMPFYSSLARLSHLQLTRLFSHCAPPPTSCTAASSEVCTTSCTNNRVWKPICLYHTHGKCTKMADNDHIQKFSHSCSLEFETINPKFGYPCSQNYDYFLVLDLEGKIEILEFPILMICARNLNVVDFFHRFVRPSKMGEKRSNGYVQSKYGKIGIDRVWQDTAISFGEVVREFEVWLSGHHLWEKGSGRILTRAAFVTCGNWDVKTKIPQQCEVSKLRIPSYFQEWINLKDIYLNFYNKRAKGMVDMMKGLQMPFFGTHHLGIDDTRNLSRVLLRMLADGASVDITAKRINSGPINYLFKNRIR